MFLNHSITDFGLKANKKWIISYQKIRFKQNTTFDWRKQIIAMYYLDKFKNFASKWRPNFQQQQQQPVHQNLNASEYQDVFQLIEEGSLRNQPQIKEQDQKEILVSLAMYYDYCRENEETSTQNTNEQQKQKIEQQLQKALRNVNCQINVSFLLNQFIYIHHYLNPENQEFNQFLSTLMPSNLNQSNVTHIKKSQLYSLSQNECSQLFIQIINKQDQQIDMDQSDCQVFQKFLEFYFDLIIDLLYRRIPLTTLLKQVQSKTQIKSLLKINVSNILTLVFQKLNLLDKISLGQILSTQYQAIPIFYKLNLSREEESYQNNIISGFYPLSESFEKHLVLNLSTSSIQKRQREDFFNYLSNNKDVISDLNEGFNQIGSVHLYTQFSNSRLNEFILIDISKLDILSIQFYKILLQLIYSSSVVFLQINFLKDFTVLLNKRLLPSIEVKKILHILDNCDYLIIIIHNANKNEKQIQDYFDDCLKSYKLQFQLRFIQENNPEYQYEALFNDLKKQTFSKKKSLEVLEKLENLFTNYVQRGEMDNFEGNITQFKQKIQERISLELTIQKLPDTQQHQLLNNMFTYSNTFSQYFFKDKIFQNFSRQYFMETNPQEKLKRKGDKLKLIKDQFSSITTLSELMLFFLEEITQNNYIKQSILSKIFSDWKLPLVEGNNKDMDQINEEIRNLEKLTKDSIDNKTLKLNLEKLYKQKNQCLILQDNYDVSIESFIREICLFSENNVNNLKYNDQKQLQKYETKVINYYKDAFTKGTPIQFIDKTRKFGSKLLDDFFKFVDHNFQTRNYIVISVVGPQSSAKSTLMNYLFRCKFETSSARCTKGMYFTKINFEGINLLIVDTEGLLSNIFRDQSFDNSVMTLLFLISHVIIFNIKDEANSTMKDMMKITEEVMKIFASEIDNNFKIPEIFIVLRDYFDRNQIDQKKKQIINEMIQVKGIFDAHKQKDKPQINLNPNNIFIFPSAFSELNQFESRFKHINTGFGEDVLQLRQSITSKLNEIRGYNSIQGFYKKAERIWNRLMEHGNELLKCVTILEYESKKKLEEIGIKYQREIFDQNKDHIEQKESDLKKVIQKYHSDESCLNRIKEEYKNFIIELNGKLNGKLESQFQEIYNEDKQINSLTPRDYTIILNKTIHKNKVQLQSKLNIFENRITSSFFNYYITQLENEFDKNIQSQVNERQFEENQQSLKNLLQKIKCTYSDKIQDLSKQFDTIDELMRQQLEQLKGEQRYEYDQSLQNLILELSPSLISKLQLQYNDQTIQSQLQQSTILDQNANIPKQFIINIHQIQSSQVQELTKMIQAFLQYLYCQKYILPSDEKDIVKFIFDQMIDYYKKFLDRIDSQYHDYINQINIKKQIFSILYIKYGESKKKKQKKFLTLKMEKFTKKISQKIKYIEISSASSSDWVEMGHQAMNVIQNKIINIFIRKSLDKMESAINHTVDTLVSDHTQALEYAFNSIYNKDLKEVNLDNFLKYSTDINRYIDEMKRDQIRQKADDLIQEKTTIFNLKIVDITKQLNEIILFFTNSNQFTFEQLIEKLNTICYEGECLNLGQEIIIENLRNKPQFIEIEEKELENENEELDEDERDDDEDNFNEKQLQSHSQKSVVDQVSTINENVATNESLKCIKNISTENQEQLQSTNESQQKTKQIPQDVVIIKSEEQFQASNDQEIEQEVINIPQKEEDLYQEELQQLNNNRYNQQEEKCNLRQEELCEQSLQQLQENNGQLNERIETEECLQINNNKQMQKEEIDIPLKSVEDQCYDEQIQTNSEDLNQQETKNNPQDVQVQEESVINCSESQIEILPEDNKNSVDSVLKNLQLNLPENKINQTSQNNLQQQNEEERKCQNDTKPYSFNTLQFNDETVQFVSDNQQMNDNLQKEIENLNFQQNGLDNLSSGEQLSEQILKNINKLENSKQQDDKNSLESYNYQNQDINQDKILTQHGCMKQDLNSIEQIQNQSNKINNEGNQLKENDQEVKNNQISINEELKEENIKLGIYQDQKQNELSIQSQEQEKDDQQVISKDLGNEEIKKEKEQPQEKENEKPLEKENERKKGIQQKNTIKKKVVQNQKKQMPVEKLYLQGMKKIYNENNEENSKKMIQQFKEDLNLEFEQSLNNHQLKMIGCQERCPFCGQKCHLELGHADDHSVMDRHLILGIHGYSKKNNYVHEFCLDTIDQGFTINLSHYDNMQDASQKLYPKWVSCFTSEKKNNQDDNFTKIIKQGYALTSNWLKQYNNKQRLFNNYDSFIPQEYKDLVQNQQELDEKYKIKWKYPKDRDDGCSSDEESNDGDKDNKRKKLKELIPLIRLFKLINLIFE